MANSVMTSGKRIWKRLWSVLPWAVTVGVSCGRGDTNIGGSGLIEATEVVISAETAGRIKEIYIEEGREIATGDTIAQIDTTTTMLRLRQAEAGREAAGSRLRVSYINVDQAAQNLELAGKEFTRISSLRESGTANQQQFDQAETAFRQASLAEQQAKASLEASRADLVRTQAEADVFEKQLQDCFPVAPLSGVVVERYVDAGEYVTTGKPLVKIAQPDTVWVKVYLPPADLTKIALGTASAIDPEDGRNAPLQGRVSWISEQAEFTPKNVQSKEARADLVYAVKITIINTGRVLKIGMPVSVKLH